MMINVLLADDQPLLLSALRTIVNSAANITVIATAGTGGEAVEKAALADVAVLDIRMPGMDGISAAKAIMAAHPSVRIIMLTTFDEEELVLSALEAGVQGFLLKDSEPEELITAIRKVYGGEAILSSAVTEPVLRAYRSSARATAALAPNEQLALSSLTPREVEVLKLISTGATNLEIAQRLVVAETTIKTHISSLLSKLQARDRVALVLFAQRAGLLPE